MTKFLLALLASSASVVVLFVGTNLPIFSSHLANHWTANTSIATVRPHLNIASAQLGLTNSRPHIPNANWGCTCALCLKLS